MVPCRLTDASDCRSRVKAAAPARARLGCLTVGRLPQEPALRLARGVACRHATPPPTLERYVSS